MIERVVISPLQPDQKHLGKGGRDIQIQWRDDPTSGRTKGTGPVRALAREQLQEMEAKRAARSE